MKTAVALKAAAPAFAQTGRAAPVGPRIEARVGYERVVLGVKATDGTTSDSDSGSTGGVTYGGEIGYDLRAGYYATIGAMPAWKALPPRNAPTSMAAKSFAKAGRNITAGLRAGYMFGNAGLLYVKGGYSNGRLRLRYEDPADTASNFDEGANRDGFHLGAGVEQSFGRNAYGKLEYVYTNYNSVDVDDGTTAGGLDFDRHQVVAGLGVRF